jgi:hypothetical protein
MKNIHTMLVSVGLLNVLGTEEVCKALDLWYSGILSHDETVDRLGGRPSTVLTNEDYRMVLSYLYYTLCA